MSEFNDLHDSIAREIVEDRIEAMAAGLAKALPLLSAELVRAAKWPAMHSPHEGYAVILEELDELKALVWMNQKRHDHAAMEEEVLQIAAMALRFYIDLILPKKPE